MEIKKEKFIQQVRKPFGNYHFVHVLCEFQCLVEQELLRIPEQLDLGNFEAGSLPPSMDQGTISTSFSS